VQVSETLRKTRGTLADGIVLAVLLATIFVAEAFNRARAILLDLREQGLDSDLAAPDWLAETWGLVALAGLAAAIYVAVRFVGIARELAPEESRTRFASCLLPWLAGAAVGVWFAWQFLAILDVANRGPSADATTVAYWAAVALAVLAVVAGGSVPGNAALGAHRASVLRVQLLFLGGLYVLVFVVPMSSAQLVDVLRAWGDRELSRPAMGVAGALLLGAVCRASATRLLVPETTPIAGPLPEALGRLIPSWAKAIGRGEVAAGAVVLAVAFAVLPGLNALVVLAAGVAVLALLTRPVAATELERTEEGERVSLRRLAGTVGVLPLVILLAGLVRASADSLLLPSGPSWADIQLLLWTGAVLAGFGVLAARAYWAAAVEANDADQRLPGETFGLLGFVLGLGMGLVPDVVAWAILVFAAALAARAFGERGAPELWGGWGVVLGVGVVVYDDPLVVTQSIGAFGLAFLGATGLMALLHVAASVGTRRRLSWRWCGRTWAAPVVLLLLAWFVGAALTLPDGMHGTRTVPAPSGGQAAPLETAVGDWLDRQRPNDRGHVPMLFVGASGGGSKAAYWTDLVIDCLLGDGTPIRGKKGADECRGRDAIAAERYERLFLTSSASGGSIGIHHLLNHASDAGRAKPWVNDTAGREVLSPVVGWGMFHDLPAALLGLPTDPSRCDERVGCPLNADRALVQEAAVAGLGEDRQLPADKGLLGRSAPITVFNGVITNRLWIPTNRRVLLSSVDLAPPVDCATKHGRHDAVDGHDLVPGRDLPLVSAAMLSARFPLLEPAARLGGDDCDRPRAIGDGGLYENTGLLTIATLLPRVRSAVRAWQEREGRELDVRPIVLSIDDDVYSVKDDQEYDAGRGNERGRRSTRVRRRLQRCRVWPRAVYRRISPTAHVGAQAATGWEISKTSREEDLGETLRTSTDARATLFEVRRMLDGDAPADCDPR
jgi:hypothetical protein